MTSVPRMDIPNGVYPLSSDVWSMGSVPRQRLSYRQYDASRVEGWLPGRVPGNVRGDLLAAGRITDPFFDRNLRDSEWVDGRDWWYRRPLSVPLAPDQRAFLRFEGIDYFSAVFVAGTLLGRHEGMFSPQEYEITRLVRERPRSELAVRIWGSDSLPRLGRTAGQRRARQLAGLLGLGDDPYPDRLATLKCQMSYGWDFAPRLLTMGIWDEVSLKVSGPAAIRQVWPQVEWPEHDPSSPGSVGIALQLVIDSLGPADAVARVEIGGANFSISTRRYDFPLVLRGGRRAYSLELQLDEPRLWWPWDRGQPHLYAVQVTLHGATGGAAWDRAGTTLGLRRVRLVPGERGRGRRARWNWEINGQREFIRGINWVPADALPGRVGASDYQELIQAARESGANLLRVWGGGLREKRAFYETCDRTGMLVWQDFPFASVFLGQLPRDDGYLELVRQEADAIVRALRDHPSVALWCGGNEFSPRRNRPVIDTLQKAVTEHDGSRPFVPASPSEGDRHNWDVWHGQAPAVHYRRDPSPFVSEFGLQAAPDVVSLRRFLATHNVWPAGEGWEAHCAQLEKLHRYADLYPWHDLESFVAASQRAQARSLQIAIEHFRRRKGTCGGLAIWQLNDPWPAISWSLIDYYRRPKLAAQLLKRWYQPLLVTLLYPLLPYRAGSSLIGEVWVVNDWMRAFPGCEVRLSQGERVLWTGKVDVAADQSRRVDRVSAKIVDPAAPLWLELWQDGERLAGNDYDLTFYDTAKGMKQPRRFRRTAAEWLLR